MAIARFKDVVLDAVDATRVGAFWGAALDRQWHAQDNGDGWLSGATPQHGIWINQVAEPLTVKNRVHFDIYTTDLTILQDLGATVLETFPRWTTMADPEGTWFCAFLPESLPADRLHGLVVDSADPMAIAQWWGRVYDVPVEISPEGWGTLENVPGMPILTMDFAAVPEPRTGKNRIHWDVSVAELQSLLDAGATLLRAADDEIYWHILADPEGNEFCAFVD
jgi:hypothetical protein